MAVSKRKQFKVTGEGRTEYDSKPFTAQYDGRCAGDCASEILAGDEVSYVDDELMHVDCVPFHPIGTGPGGRGIVCINCNLVHNGECL